MQALGWSLVAAVGWSTMPVAVHLFAGDADPFIYAAASVAAIAGSIGLGLVACGHPLRSLTVKVVRAAAAMRHEGIRGCVTLVAFFAALTNHGLFVVASRHAGIVEATVLYQLWPLAAAVLLAEKGGSRRRRLRGSTGGMMAAAFVVTAVAAASQIPDGHSHGIWWLGVLSGAAAGVFGGAVVSETAIVGYHAGRSAGPAAADATDAVVLMLAALMVCAASAAAADMALAAATGGLGQGIRPEALFAAAAAGVMSTVAAVGSRWALVRCSGLGTVAVQGLDIVLASIWLALTGAGFRHGWLFAGCVVALTAVNALIQASDADRPTPQPAAGS